MEQLGSQYTDFHEIWHLRVFRKSVEKIRVSLKSYTNNGYFTWGRIHIYIMSLSFLLRIRNVSEKLCTVNQNTHFVFSNFFLIFPFMRWRGNILYHGAGHRWQHGACAFHAGYLRLQIHTLRLCNTHCFPTATMVARTPLNVTLYVHCVSYYSHQVLENSGTPVAMKNNDLIILIFFIEFRMLVNRNDLHVFSGMRLETRRIVT